MGFMDKAKAAAQDAAKKGKELADQAQQKIDEMQKNQGGGQSSTNGDAVAHDKHGRSEPHATPDAGDTTPPHGDPLSESTSPPAAPEAQATPDAGDTTPPHGDPLSEPKPPTPPSGAAGLTSGDPLGG